MFRSLKSSFFGVILALVFVLSATQSWGGLIEEVNAYRGIRVEATLIQQLEEYYSRELKTEEGLSEQALRRLVEASVLYRRKLTYFDSKEIFSDKMFEYLYFVLAKGSVKEMDGPGLHSFFLQKQLELAERKKELHDKAVLVEWEIRTRLKSFNKEKIKNLESDLKVILEKYQFVSGAFSSEYSQTQEGNQDILSIDRGLIVGEIDEYAAKKIKGILVPHAVLFKYDNSIQFSKAQKKEI